MSSPGEQPRAALVRWAALYLVLVQCAALGWLVDGRLFALIMGTLATLALIPQLRIEPQQAPHWFWFALLGVILAVKHRIAPEQINEQITFFNTVAGYEAARFLVFLQTVQLYIRRPGGRMPSWIAGVACLSMVFGANVRLNPGTRPVSMGLGFAFTAGLALFAALNRRRAAPRVDRTGLIVGVVAVLFVLIGGLATARAFHRLEATFERWLAERSGFERSDNVTTGFSGRGEIGEISGWKQHAADRIAIRIHAAAAPGYLRGMVFDDLRRRTWADTTQVSGLGEYPSTVLQGAVTVGRIYRLIDDTDERRVGDPLEFWPDSLTRDRLFLPQEAAFLSTTSPRVVVNEHGLVVRSDEATSVPYTAWLNETQLPQPLSNEARARYLVLHNDLPTELSPFAAEAFGAARSTSERVTAIEQFFHQNFEYALIAQPMRSGDPIIHFLTDRTPAHCEYFATAGVLLLRSVGIPARYVTGYVATEWNPHGEYWVARRKDAHAWIEAYDDQASRWVTVECTPPGGVPNSPDRTGFAVRWDAWMQALREWLHRSLQGGLQGALLAVWTVITSVPGIAMLILGTAAVVLWKLRRTARIRAELSPRPLYPPLLRELRRAERMARRLGCRRGSAETLSDFSTRLRHIGTEPIASSALADWYDEYVRVRYGAQDALAHVDALKSKLRAVRNAARHG